MSDTPKKKRDFPRLKNHPDYMYIKQQIEEGVSPAFIEGELVEKYPTDKTMWLSHAYLYQYRIHEYPDLAEAGRRSSKQQMAETKAGRKHKVKAVYDEDDDISTKIMKLTGRSPPPPVPRKDLTDDNLVSWSDETADSFKSFVEDMIVERGSPVVLQGYQHEMADLMINNTRVVFVTGGQVGKDFMMMCFTIWWAVTHPGSQQVVMCATQSQSTALRDRTEMAVYSSVDLADAHGGIKASKPDIMLGFRNGAIIYYMTAKSLIAGKTALDVVYVNEARDIREEEVTRVSPLLGVGKGARLFVLSRPRFKRGYLWECFTNPRFKRLQVPTEKNQHFNRQVLEDDRATLSPDLFKIEYLGEFADSGSSYFNEAAIDKCSEREYDYKQLIPEEDYEYYLGVDPARLADVSAFILVGIGKERDNDGFRIKVAYVHGFSPDRGYGGDSTVQYAHIAMIQDRLGDQLKMIIPEKTGMGGPFTEQLLNWWRDQGRSTSIIKPYDTNSLQAKLALYGECKRVIEGEGVKIPRQESRLLNELKMTQFGSTLQGHVKVETPVTDDYADALCLALWGAKKPFQMGVGVIKRVIERTLFSQPTR